MDEKEMEKRLRWYEHKFGPYIERRGLRNWKNLFRKPSLSDWLILFMLLMALFISWAYQHDIQICREYIKEQQNDWMNFTNGTGKLYVHPENQTENLWILPIFPNESQE